MKEEVLRCQIQEWYPRFKPYSLKTLIHELPETFVQYLMDDSGPFLLPKSIYGDDAFPQRVKNPIDEEDFQVQETDNDSEDEFQTSISFPELESTVKQSIEILGGSVFPKLNWSAPKDTAWISTTGNLCCASFLEIVLLLRSSDNIIHDLCHAFDSCSDPTIKSPYPLFLALRKYYPSMRPEMEFRCFVRRGNLIGISQREVTGFYPILVEKKHELEESVVKFFLEIVKPSFDSDDYTFDVYVTSKDKVKLVDFNPWEAFTLPLLFTWAELEDESLQFEFRIVETQCAVRPGLKTAVPVDYLDTSPGSGWDQFLRRANDQYHFQANCSESSI